MRKYIYYPKYLLLFRFFLIAFYLSFIISISKAEIQKGKEVTIDLAEVAVLHEAKLLYGEVRVYDVMTYYSFEGKPEVYCFTLYRKVGNMPSIKLILKRIRAAKTMLRSKHESISKMTDPADQKKEMEKLKKSETRAICLTEEFVTVFAGAHEGHVPVIRVHKGLPPQILYQDEVLETAKEISSGPHRMRRGIYFSMYNFGYELEPSYLSRSSEDEMIFPGAGDNLFIDPYRLKGMKISKLKEKIEEKRAKMLSKTVEQIKAEEARRSILQEKWNFVRKLAKLKEKNK